LEKKSKRGAEKVGVKKKRRGFWGGIWGDIAEQRCLMQKLRRIEKNCRLVG
jgi:hypothetical protein